MRRHEAAGAGGQHGGGSSALGEPASEIESRLAELAERGLTRRTRVVEGPQGPEVMLDGRPVTLLCSNNYLGLAGDPAVRQAAAEAAQSLGAGAGASRLVSGTMSVHNRLEAALAEFEGTQACVLFGSGYLANMGAIGALAGRGDVIFSDELNHASIVDGCRLSRAQVVVYRHLDAEHLAWCLRRHGGGAAASPDAGAARGILAGRSATEDGGAATAAGNARRRLIVTDSVFSMDGDVAPLSQIVQLARAHRARLIVDEAHATGALGPGGRGAIAAAGLEGEVDVIVGTLGKALGSYGAYVCASEQMVRYLINLARPLIYSTAPPPPQTAAAAAALQMLRERPQLPAQLRNAARVLRSALSDEGFAVMRSDMHIVPLITEREDAAVRLCEAAIERGVFAQAIRPPTVPAGTSRLRLAAMATHSEHQLRTAAGALRDAAEAIGLDPRTLGDGATAEQAAALRPRP